MVICSQRQTRACVSATFNEQKVLGALLGPTREIHPRDGHDARPPVRQSVVPLVGVVHVPDLDVRAVGPNPGPVVHQFLGHMDAVTHLRGQRV